MNNSVIEQLKNKFKADNFRIEETKDAIPTAWVKRDRVTDVLHYLKNEIPDPYKMLYDLTAIDERTKSRINKTPGNDFTVVYQLLSFDRNEDIRIKVPIKGDDLELPSITNLWRNADWYEREVYDMFGVNFNGHPHLRRILMPDTWKGHPLQERTSGKCN